MSVSGKQQDDVFLQEKQYDISSQEKQAVFWGKQARPTVNCLWETAVRMMSFRRRSTIFFPQK